MHAVEEDEGAENFPGWLDVLFDDSAAGVEINDGVVAGPDEYNLRNRPSQRQSIAQPISFQRNLWLSFAHSISNQGISTHRDTDWDHECVEADVSEDCLTGKVDLWKECCHLCEDFKCPPSHYFECHVLPSDAVHF